MYIPDYQAQYRQARHDERVLGKQIQRLLDIPEEDRNPDDTPVIRLLFRLNRDAHGRALRAEELSKMCDRVFGD